MQSTLYAMISMISLCFQIQLKETENINVTFDKSRIKISKSSNYMHVKWKIWIGFIKIMSCKRRR